MASSYIMLGVHVCTDNTAGPTTIIPPRDCTGLHHVALYHFYLS